MRDNNGKTFIATLYNELLAQDLCDQSFSVITLMNLIHTFLFHKGLCTIFFSENEQNTVTLLFSAQRKRAFLVKMKEKSKSQKQIPFKKYLELLDQKLGHISTRLLLAGYTHSAHRVRSPQ